MKLEHNIWKGARIDMNAFGSWEEYKAGKYLRRERKDDGFHLMIPQC